MDERISDINCRELCPYIKVHRDVNIRPCVKEVTSGQEFCINRIKAHFSDRGLGPVNTLVTIRNIKIINERDDQIGTVVNGVATINPIFPVDLTNLEL